ncbi:hypothetical protein [Desulfopila sp. IMCC35008]|uniref:hypothetical protein n=1 Tax=Desulfopila sp. IMCC35008 TaxID=2653858 RepID=UPI0013D4F09C|nr:hypothetical protein [Desulfopila sp. IMCC35008]
MEERRTFLKRTEVFLLGLAGSTALGASPRWSTTAASWRPQRRTVFPVTATLPMGFSVSPF